MLAITQLLGCNSSTLRLLSDSAKAIDTYNKVDDTVEIVGAVHTLSSDDEPCNYVATTSAENETIYECKKIEQEDEKTITE